MNLPAYEIIVYPSPDCVFHLNRHKENVCDMLEQPHSELVSFLTAEAANYPCCSWTTEDSLLPQHQI